MSGSVLRAGGHHSYDTYGANGVYDVATAA